MGIEGEMRKCGKCGKCYESYVVFIPKDFSSIVSKVKIDKMYGNVCKERRAELAPNHAFDGASEIEVEE